jgi:hypothetical protein
MSFLKVKIHIIIPAVLYGCETWSFTSRQEHRLRAFENRVLRRIFGPGGGGGTGRMIKGTTFTDCTAYHVGLLLGRINERRDGWYM